MPGLLYSLGVFAAFYCTEIHLSWGELTYCYDNQPQGITPSTIHVTKLLAHNNLSADFHVNLD